eukprot:Hpha_TRINITY_DN16497_c0_g1::TRINITY_DN16497_c0_g1_i1::g.161104::m.161104
MDHHTRALHRGCLDVPLHISLHVHPTPLQEGGGDVEGGEGGFTSSYVCRHVSKRGTGMCRARGRGGSPPTTRTEPNGKGLTGGDSKMDAASAAAGEVGFREVRATSGEGVKLDTGGALLCVKGFAVRVEAHLETPHAHKVPVLVPPQIAGALGGAARADVVRVGHVCPVVALQRVVRVRTHAPGSKVGVHVARSHPRGLQPVRVLLQSRHVRERALSGAVHRQPPLVLQTSLDEGDICAEVGDLRQVTAEESRLRPGCRRVSGGGGGGRVGGLVARRLAREKVNVRETGAPGGETVVLNAQTWLLRPEGDAVGCKADLLLLDVHQIMNLPNPEGATVFTAAIAAARLDRLAKLGEPVAHLRSRVRKTRAPRGIVGVGLRHGLLRNLVDVRILLEA